MRRETILQAHPSNAMCLQFSPSGGYFAVGSADALVSLWDSDEFVCLRTLSRCVSPHSIIFYYQRFPIPRLFSPFFRLEWPVRALGFSHDSQLIASASEDHFIDIGCVETGERWVVKMLVFWSMLHQNLSALVNLKS